MNLLAFYIKPFLFHRILVGFPLLLLAYLTSFNQLQKLCLCRYETQYLPQQINVQMTSFLKSKHIILLSVALTTKCQDNKYIHFYWKWGFNHTFMIIIPITILHFCLISKSKSPGMWDVFGIDFTLDILLKKHMASSSYSSCNWFCWGCTLCAFYPSSWKIETLSWE